MTLPEFSDLMKIISEIEAGSWTLIQQNQHEDLPLSRIIALIVQNCVVCKTELSFELAD